MRRPLHFPDVPMCPAYWVAEFRGDPIKAVCEYRSGHLGDHLSAGRRFPNSPKEETHV